MTNQNSESRLAGKVALVTGAANGIGRATAERLASDGANLVLFDLPDSPLDALIATLNTQAIAVTGDVSRPRDWAKVMTEAQAALGGVDILVNSAGVSGPLGRLEDCPIDEFDRAWAINVRGIFLGMKAVITSMRQRGGGAIVNISSISGQRGNPRIPTYTTTKHAVDGLSKCAALDLSADGIRVNVVSPAPTNTDMMKRAEASISQARGLTAEAVQQAMIAGIPLGRYGEPAEIAAVIAFLCGPEASFMTGAIVPVDGGVLAQ